MKLRLALSIASLTVSLSAVTACGSQPPPAADTPTPPTPSTPATEPTAEATATPEPHPADIPWSEMNDEQKEEHMRQTVQPNMEALFKSFDAAEFPELTCDSCHGPGSEDKGEFEMPNADLPVLDPTGGFAAAKKEHPKGVEFMMQQVVPTMAGLLDMQPYNPETQKGLGCFHCHTQPVK